MSISEFYDKIKKNSKANTELNQLYKKPVPESGINMPIAQVFKPNTYYQADVLYMPEDGDFAYMLVCVDMYDGSIDAEQIKEVNSKEVIKAFGEIFKRKYLEYPVFITLDKGKEFNTKEIVEYFKSAGVNVKYSLTGRSRQLANVERANQTIQTILFKRMASQELLTGEVSKEWVSDLKPLMEVLNKRKKKPLTQEINPLPLVDEYNGKLLQIGQKVRLKLDYPINNTNNARLNGTFRSSDIKWSPKVYKITEVLLKPGFPPMYLTDINDNVARNKNQLAKVRRNEAEPEAKFIRGTPEFHIITGILDKEVRPDKKTYYLIKYKGYEGGTWEKADILNRTKDLRAMRKAFNDENGN
jgi:hypothetical protein